MKQSVLVSLCAAMAVSCAPISAAALTTSREAPPEITDKAYMFPAFGNGEVLLEKKQGRLPAMGWNSWNPFGSDNTEALTKAQADAMVDLGLDDLGYEYIVLDDGCYGSKRDSEGRIPNNPDKFPSGFKALGDYIHDKGLKFGMYNDIGTNLCAGAEVGTAGYEDIDAQTYKDWGVDFLKVDNCYYLWDNATFSKSENAKYVYAPKIRAVTVSGSDFSTTLNAVSDGVLAGSGAAKNSEGNFVNNIGVKDGTNTGTSPVGDMWSELRFTVNAPSDGEYYLTVNYASGEEIGTGSWLQAAVGEIENETRYYDGLLPSSGGASTFKDSEPIKINLKSGENIIRIMNHRRQENTLYSYAALRNSLNQYDPERDTVLSICEWGKTQPQNWGYKVGNSWRILNDITFSVGVNGSASWDAPGTASVASQYNKAVIMDEFSGLDKGWNDAELLVIGMKGITETMSKTHMTAWCMMNSPLMLGMDLRNVKKGDAIWNIIANEDAIALNQDALGIQAKRIYSSAVAENPDTTYTENNNRVDILAKPLANGDVALSFINLSRNAEADTYSVSVDDIISFIGKKMKNSDAFKAADCYSVKDIWSKKSSLNTDGVFEVKGLDGCDNVTIRISPLSGDEDIHEFLKGEIDTANALKESQSVVIGGVKEALEAAISEANAVYENTSASYDDIIAAHKALSDAEKAFNDAYAEYALLTKAAASAKTILAKPDNYVNDSSWTEFVSAVQNAEQIIENPVSADAVADALNKLNAAKAAVKWDSQTGYEPLAWYVFDDTVSKTVRDVSGNGNDAELVNSGAKILDGNILSLNSDNEDNGYLQLPSGILSKASDFSFTAWVNIGEHRTWARLFDFGMSSSDGYMFASPSNGSGRFGFAMTKTTNNAEQGVSAEPPEVGKWVHIAVIKSGTTATIYYNGKSAASGTVTLTPAECVKDAVSCYIGKSQWSDPYIKAQLRDVRIYDKALTEEQLLAIEDEGASKELEINISGGSNVKFDISNPTSKAKTVQMFAAKYTGGGVLEKVFAKEETIAPKSDISVSSDFDFGGAETEVKAFVWDENNRPLTNARTLTLNRKMQWDITRENKADYTVNSDTSVTINTRGGDLWGTADGGGSAANLYLAEVPEQNADSFTAEVTVKYKPGADYQRAALIAYAGDGDHVTVMRRYHSAYGGNVFMTTMNTAGKAGDENKYTADNGSEECKLRLVKSGDVFKGYFSTDNGATWNELEARTQTALASAKPLKIGFYASNGEYEADSEPVTFENFTFNDYVIKFDGAQTASATPVTSEQFTAMLLNDDMKSALQRGIITDLETENADKPITRKSAARIVHETLRRVYNEPDNENWQGAEALSDLYDCGSCAMHIAQVYVKGIMTGSGDGSFNADGTLTESEAETVVNRVKNAVLRTPPETAAADELISFADAKALAEDGAAIVDVRPAADYAAGHIPGSVSVPMENILSNPSAAFAELSRDNAVIVYCKSGVNSRRASAILREAGYPEVYNLGGIDGKGYALIAG